ncbi:lipase class 3 family protein [Pholiota conissans]|uniref:Lipase class 3 family protein n=1 Tax=Pholiota conissans TaxID=109636 RepID=A0A9P5Z323_9AGAR|nr:lipase class 3 family protein [Pholiota conissans]
MFSKRSILSAVLCALTVVNAAPALVEVSKRQSITALTTAQIGAFRPFTHFASTAYCQPSTTINWSCGANCAANPDFIPTASGGDGSSVQFWYVGFSPSQNTVIVGHQGTDTSQIEADATDADAFLESLDSSLFPGVSSSVEAHSGFANEQAKTATTILSAVQSTIKAHSATAVTIVGHSLGAAIALLDGVYLPLHISGVSFKVIGYGMPRVGNQAFADYVDAHLALMHINNKEDIVPIVPGRFLGYHHPSGEVHIMDNNQWVSCPGQDNTSTECIVGDVPNIFDGDTSDHDGPYDTVTMGC